MTRHAPWIGAAAALSLLAAGCAGKVPPPLPQAQAPSDLVVLIVDPDNGRLGSAVVRAQGGMAELTEDRSATRIVPGGAPSSPAPLSADDIARLFGGALSARPLPPRGFLLYFQTGSDDLTPESQAELP